jgi:uncharacterized membrane protein
LFAIGLIFYLIIVRIENVKQERSELEIILFTIFLIIWIQFMIFKNAFLQHGFSIIWQNIPLELLSLYFEKTNIIQAMVSIGFIPLFAGVYVTYRYFFKEKNKSIYLLISFALASSLLLWLKLVPLKIGLAFLGIVFVLLFSRYIIVLLEYIKKTKFQYLKTMFILFLAVFFLTSVMPSYYFTKQTLLHSPSSQEIEAFEWFSQNSEENSTVLGVLEQGSLITAVAKRKNVFDSNFLLIKDASARLKDVERMYSTQYETEAVELLSKYGIDYIVVSPSARYIYEIKDLKYENPCLNIVYDKNIKIYRSECRLETLK